MSIPKTGSMSICSVLGIPRHLMHRPASKCRLGFRFAFIREPLSRFMSAYAFCQSSRYPKVAPLPAFREFVLSGHRPAVFFAPQVSFLDADVSFVGRFDALQSGFVAVCAALGLPPTKLPRLHKTEPSGEWDAETRAYVMREYAEDFDLWRSNLTWL